MSIDPYANKDFAGILKLLNENNHDDYLRFLGVHHVSYVSWLKAINICLGAFYQTNLPANRIITHEEASTRKKIDAAVDAAINEATDPWKKLVLSFVERYINCIQQFVWSAEDAIAAEKMPSDGRFQKIIDMERNGTIRQCKAKALQMMARLGDMPEALIESPEYESDANSLIAQQWDAIIEIAQPKLKKLGFEDFTYEQLKAATVIFRASSNIGKQLPILMRVLKEKAEQPERGVAQAA